MYVTRQGEIEWCYTEDVLPLQSPPVALGSLIVVVIVVDSRLARRPRRRQWRCAVAAAWW